MEWGFVDTQLEVMKVFLYKRWISNDRAINEVLWIKKCGLLGEKILEQIFLWFKYRIGQGAYNVVEETALIAWEGRRAEVDVRPPSVTEGFIKNQLLLIM